MPILYAPISLLGWGLFTLGISWPTEYLLRLVWQRGTGGSRVPWFSFSAGLGFALTSTIINILASVGAIQSIILLILFLAVLASGGLRLALIIFRRLPNPIAGLSTFTIVALILAISMMPFIALPPIAWDSLVYHLEIPRQYLVHGGVIEIPRNVFAYFPMGIEMLYLFCLAILPPFVTQMLHAGFLILTVFALGETAAVAGILPQKDRGLVGLLVAAAFFMPTLWLDAVVPYIDVAFLFYATLVGAGFFLYYRHRSSISLDLALLAGTFLVTIKYTGYYFLLVIVLAALTTLLRRRGSSPFNARSALVLSMGLLVFAGPYFIRNFTWTGNPLFPFLVGIIGRPMPHWTSEQNTTLMSFLSNWGNVLPSRLLYPLNYLIALGAPNLENDSLFDGALGPLLGLWGLLWLLRRRLNREHFFLVMAAVLYALAWGLFLRQARFLFPMVPLMLLLLLGCYRYLSKKIIARLALLFLGVVSLTFSALIILPEIKPGASESKSSTQLSPAYLTGRETERDYLRRTLPIFSCQDFINTQLPAQARIWVLFTTNRNFYLRRPYIADYVIEDFTFHHWLLNSHSADDLVGNFHQEGITHILARLDLFSDPALYVDDPPRRLLVNLFRKRSCIQIFSANGYVVLALPAQASPI